MQQSYSEFVNSKSYVGYANKELFSHLLLLGVGLPNLLYL